ncbi:beta-ketoacyl-[acyl-carrier-protein] synthase family protein [Streptomyces xanthophaeus]|uniref:beta-ketoacyl-[acyl-carrier-protein] synthase family protein n=1 Tax=Streptomyces xanthophaeus TaxID=67385 RepID=UPI00399036A4
MGLSQKVLVTGLGPVSSLGIGRDAFDAALFAGQVGTSTIRSFDTSEFRTDQAGEVHDFEAGQICKNVTAEQYGRSSLLAAAAARLAVEDAGLGQVDLDNARIAICMGTTSGESQEMERATAEYLVTTPGVISADVAGKLPAQRIGEAVVVELDAGHSDDYTFSTACSASNYSIAFGSLLIASGKADIAIVGGADAVCRWAHAGFYRLGAMSPDLCRPFDAEREGMLTAEGGVALVLESEAHAKARGAVPLATVLGAGINCDADHMVAPNRDSVARCIRLAHERAGITPDQVDYISAHGTGTKANDATESSAIADVFGANPPPVSSIKSMLGHTMGAASGFGAVACVLGLLRQMCPPTANFRQLDPDVPLTDVVPNVGRPARLDVVQNHGFAFGGNNAIVLFGKV